MWYGLTQPCAAWDHSKSGWLNASGISALTGSCSAKEQTKAAKHPEVRLAKLFIELPPYAENCRVHGSACNLKSAICDLQEAPQPLRTNSRLVSKPMRI